MSKKNRNQQNMTFFCTHAYNYYWQLLIQWQKSRKRS